MGETNTLRKHPRSHFTTLQNSTLRDGRLSWKARGLFAFLWSHSQDFKFSVEWLTTKAKDGRDSTKAAMKELQRYGYLTITRIRGKDGRYIRIEWHLVDEPPATRGRALPPRAENPLEDQKRKNHTRGNGIPVFPSSTAEEPRIRKTTTTEPSKRELAAGLILPRALHSTEKHTALDVRELRWEDLPQLGEAERVVVVGMLEGLPVAQQQDVIDELGGAFLTGTIRGPWPAWLQAVIQRARHGSFQLNLALSIRAKRERREREAAEERQRQEERRRIEQLHRDPGHKEAVLAKVKRAYEAPCVAHGESSP